MRTIEINLADRSYSILIESGLLTRAGELVRQVAASDRALLVVDSQIASSHGAQVGRALEQAGFRIAIHEFKAEETGKSLEAMRNIYAALLAAKMERSSPVIALGGGIVGDVAGFAAATYLRGVPLIQIPTTLLAMVDASIGGKTGVNYPLPPGPDGQVTLGKNLIGSFWQPRMVLTDPSTLLTLASRDFRSGLAECVKHGMIADASLLDFLTTHKDKIAALDLGVLTDLIERSARIKASIVMEDETEADRRALLNLGHTFAHVIEPIAALDLRHGEAVSIGLCAAIACSILTGRLAETDQIRLRELLEGLGLPVRLANPVSIPTLISAMRYDKKVSGGQIRLILPTQGGGAEIVEGVEESLIAQAWADVGADPEG